MHFLAIGLNHRTAPISVREQVVFDGDGLRAGLKSLASVESVREGFILSTCNRVEIYVLAESEDPRFVKAFLAQCNETGVDLSPHFYVYADADALRHACAVAAGLDSMVLGEPQIFGQMKDALNTAVECTTAGAALVRLFGRVFSVVKKARTKTSIGEFPVSVSHMAVKLAQKVFPSLDKATVLVLGAGDMGQLTLRNLVHVGVRNVFLANRTFSRAVEIADQFHGTPIMIHEVREYLVKSDILISCVTVPEFVISGRDGAAIVQERGGRPLCIIDLSVPRSIDKEIAAHDSIHAYDVDDLQELADSNFSVRKGEAEKAAELIDSHTGDLLKYLSVTNVDPAIGRLRTEAENIRQSVLKDSVASIALSAEQAAAVDTMTKSIAEKIVFLSEHELKEFVSSIR